MVVDMKRRCISVGKHRGHLRDLAHEVKNNRNAIYEAAKIMASYVSKDKVLVPIPSHTGDARYTYDIAYAISILTGAKVVDALQGFNRKSSHEAKLEGKSVKSKIWFFKPADVELPDGNVVLIDNCIATGKTIEAARKALNMEAIALTITNASIGN